MTDEISEDRPDEDDYDLLTYGEAGARLTEEIRRQSRVLADLESSGADSTATAAVRHRIEDLRAAAKRQQTAKADLADFSKFFGYDPRTK